MRGVVSTFDSGSDSKVRTIWTDLNTKFGLATLQEGLVPHLSWHVAEDYDLVGLMERLTEITVGIPAFEIHTNGLGVFTGKNLVLYLAIVKDTALAELHHKVWKACEPFASGSSPFYTEQSWIPHVTLAADGLEQENVPKVLRSLSGRELKWTMRVGTICVGRHELGQAGELDCNFGLEGDPDENLS
jgi:2'-5' RNA ligase